MKKVEDNDTLTLEMEADKIEISSAAKTILKKHKLDFEILKVPLVGEHRTADGHGLFYLPTGDFGLFRDDNMKCLKTGFKAGYRVSQNAEVVELVLKGSAGFGDLKITKAGSLFDGKKIFIQLELKGFAKVGNDQIKRYITIIDSNDGSTGLSVGIGDLTMSCSNQFFRFYKAGQMKMRHSNSMDTKILEIPNLITIALAEQMKLINAYNRFEKTEASEKLVNKWVKDIVGMDRAEAAKKKDVTTKAINNMENLYTHISKEMKQKGNNVWGLHSGVTSWTTHTKQAPKRTNGRLESLMTGTNYKTNEKSLNMALKLVKMEKELAK